MPRPSTSPRVLLKVLEGGAAKSAAQMTKLSGQKWSIHVISASGNADGRFLSILSRDARDYYGVSLSTTGERYLAIFSRESCRAIADAYFGRLGSRRPSYNETDAVEEIANVMVNSIAGAIAEFQGGVHMVTAPTTAWGKKSELYKRCFQPDPSLADVTSVLIHISSPSLASDCTLLIQLDRLSVLFLLNPPPET